MAIFAPLYEKALRWSNHPQAPKILGMLSFCEAIFFPVMPEVMLAPMTLAQPKRWASYASISLIWALLGAGLAYLIGYLAFDFIRPWLDRIGYAEDFEKIKSLAAEQGFWLLLIGGFTPVPFKLLTLASGAVAMPILPFIAGVIIGRGKRVFLVTGVIRLGGARAEAWLRANIERVGMMMLLLLLVIVAIVKLRPQA